MAAAMTWPNWACRKYSVQLKFTPHDLYWDDIARNSLIYPDKPVFCGVGLLKVRQLKVLVSDYDVAGAVKPCRTPVVQL